MRRRDFNKAAGVSAAGVLFTPVCVSAADPQGGWRWCRKCEGLWFAGGGANRPGRCPGQDGHDATDSGKYTLAHVG